MKLNKRFILIPRNNWDYGFRALLCSLKGLHKASIYPSNMEEMYQITPIWTNSGRTSLFALLKALELPAGSKIGVPLFCCPVVFNSIYQAGLIPCFLDSNLKDFNISLDDFRKKSKDIAAVIAVHMFGNPCDIDAINKIAGNKPVIEDCAHSIFSTYKGKQTGLLSTASFFTFRCGKYISAGEGSAILCKDREIQKKLEQVMGSFESMSTLEMIINSLLTFLKATMYNRPWYGLLGFPIGMRLDKKYNLTAKKGLTTGKIPPTNFTLINSRIYQYKEKINIQRNNAHKLLSAIEPGVAVLPSENDGCSSNWYQFPLKFKNKDQRDFLADYLYNQGIDTSKYLDDIANEVHILYGYQYGDCLNAELLSKTVLLVPIHYNLRPKDINHIARSINDGSTIAQRLSVGNCVTQ